MKSRILLVSGHYPVSNWQAQTNHHLTAAMAGIDYRHMTHCTYATSPYMHKIAWLRELLGLYDFVFWIDDDSFFTGAEGPDFEFLSKSKLGFFLVGREGNRPGYRPPINSCFFGLRNTKESFELLEAAEALTDDQVESLWNNDDGRRYGGDQDRLWLAMRQQSRKSPDSQFDLINGIEFNGRAGDFACHQNENFPKLLHLTGRNNRKWRTLRNFESRKLFGYGLIPKPELVKYPLIRHGHHRILASRTAQLPVMEKISRWLPASLLEKLGVNRG